MLRRLAATMGTVAALALCGPGAGRAGGLELRDWLARPGVRLVAVEFYASWCEPCMAAVPAWKALHERHRKDGLRLVVVNTQDPEGQCANPGWNPDQVVCDPEGDIARALNVGTSLPAAFLWSWQGNLLVRRGHVAEVADKAAEYLRALPRVAIEAFDSKGKPSRHLGSLLRDALNAHGKLSVVAGREEKARLRKLRRESHALDADEKLACELGQEVSANSLLRASLGGPKGKRQLNLTLFSAESACLLAAATAPWDKGHADRSVAEGVDKLLARVRGTLELPEAPPTARVPAGPAQAGATPSATAPPEGRSWVPLYLAGGAAVLSGAVATWAFVDQADAKEQMAAASEARDRSAYDTAAARAQSTTTLYYVGLGTGLAAVAFAAYDVTSRLVDAGAVWRLAPVVAPGGTAGASLAVVW